MGQWDSSPNARTPSWSDIADASDASYTPTTVDAGNLLRVLVDYDDAIGSGRTASSAVTQTVGKPGTISLDSTNPVVGVPVTARLTDDDGNVSGHMWQWDRAAADADAAWLSITNATSVSYTPRTDDGVWVVSVRSPPRLELHGRVQELIGGASGPDRPEAPLICSHLRQPSNDAGQNCHRADDRC